MKRRLAAGLFLLAGLCLMVPGTGVLAQAPAQRPNIILLVADDHAVQALSAYMPELIDTPNLDNIATAGVLFEQAFVGNSRSAPGRASLITGVHSHQHGVRRDGDIFDGESATVQELLRAAGYRTALFGAWQLGSEPAGFDDMLMPAVDASSGPDGGGQASAGGNQALFDGAIRWLEAHAQDSQPWLLMLNANGPGALPADLLPAETRSVGERREDLHDYLAHIESLDAQVGRLLNWLEGASAPDNTLLIYTSDQGLYLGEQGRQGMGYMFELSLRVPLLIHWPGQAVPGRRSEALVQNIDIMPTLLAAARVPVPASVQGQSLVPLLAADNKDFRDAIYYHFYDSPGLPGVARHRGVRNYRFKLMHYYEDGDQWAFYDLKHDPGEVKNVYDDPLWGILGDVAHKQLIKYQEQYGDSPELARELLEADRAGAAR